MNTLSNTDSKDIADCMLIKCKYNARYGFSMKPGI